MMDDPGIGPRVPTVLAAANDEAARLCHHYVATEHILLDLAASEARAFGHHWLATEHLLLGLIVEEHGVAVVSGRQRLRARPSRTTIRLRGPSAAKLNSAPLRRQSLLAAERAARVPSGAHLRVAIPVRPTVRTARRAHAGSIPSSA